MKQNMQVEYRKPETLNPAPYNPRKMDDEAFARLKRGIKDFGMVDPIIARRSDGLVVGGHQRLRAAQELGWSVVPVVLLDDLDDQRAAALNVLLNNPNAQGEWDMAKLSELLSTLDSEGFDATMAGFSDGELEEILSWNPGDALQGSHSTVDGDGDPAFNEGELIKIRVRSVSILPEVADALRVFIGQHPEWDAEIEG